MSGPTGLARVKNAIAHQVWIGHLFCARHVVPSWPAEVPENTQKFASWTIKYQAKNLIT
jgi:hypothetical protein